MLKRPFVAFLSMAACCLTLSMTGCSSRPKLKVAYIGLTCEAPIFVAHEMGMFTEEGLDVELVKTDWDGLREGLSLGTFDANHTLLMYLLTSISQGADLKVTGGIHTGCLRVQVGVKSEIKSIKDLKAKDGVPKKIGVPTHLGSPPYLFASRVLVANGIDPNPAKKEIEWAAFPPEALSIAIEKGQVDAIATSDPIGTVLIDKGLVRAIADQAEDDPYRDEYCCVSVVGGKLARENPDAAAKLTRALFKATKWVQENPTAAGTLSVEKKYASASVEVNCHALAKLRYIPGVAKCKTSIESAAREMQKAGLLKDKADPEAIAKRAWVDLPGVTDEWISGLKTAQVPGGGRPAELARGQFAALWNTQKACCYNCCID